MTAACLFRPRWIVFRPVDASKERFLWFPEWIPKTQTNLDLIDLVKSYPFSNKILFLTSIWLRNFDFDEAENESSKVCHKVIRYLQID